jgi:repressor LexA
MFKYQWILEGLEMPGKTRVGLAKALGRQPSMVTDLLNGTRELKAREIPIIVEYLGVMPPPIEGAAKIVGRAGDAADGMVRYCPAEKSYGEALMPPGSKKDTVAIELIGDALRALAQSGSLIYYDDIRQPPTAEMLGELCIVGLADERVLIKYLHPGRGNDLFDLESASAPTLRDAQVVWASLVTAIIPRAQARKIIRREPAANVAPPHKPKNRPKKRR